MLIKLLLLLYSSHHIRAIENKKTVLMTELFNIELTPPMFNWTSEVENQYVYQASLYNSPDLPSWINFIYSEQHRAGYLYGVPPENSKPKISLEIIALNKKNYDTRIEKFDIIVSKKLTAARYKVYLKIDNLNVEDMFEAEHMEALKKIFYDQLWRNSAKDLYVTFLGSAVELGARKPIDPTKKEGVVISLGSFEPFSTELRKLQEEVVPLRKMLEKMSSCPREFKRTSVEMLFRNVNFTLDWCSFKLIDENDPSGSHHSGANQKLLSMDEETLESNHWEPMSRSSLPQRGYYYELLVSILVPTFIMIALASILSFVLCFQHEDVDDESEEFFNNLYHICTDYYYNHYIYRVTRHVGAAGTEEPHQFASIQSTTDSVGGLTKSREMSLSPDAALLSRSHTNSPTSTIGRGVHCRPSPPPYIRPKFKPEL